MSRKIKRAKHIRKLAEHVYMNEGEWENLAFMIKFGMEETGDTRVVNQNDEYESILYSAAWARQSVGSYLRQCRELRRNIKDELKRYPEQNFGSNS